nr:hypothetical protein [Tanacetum cinerariifolium]
FVQLIINHQLGDMTHRKEIFDTLSLTKKVFANMKMVGIFQANVQTIPIPTEPSNSKPQKKHKPKRKHTQEPEVPSIESLAKHNLPSPSHDLLPIGEDSLKLKELMDFRTNLSNKFLDLESEVIGIKSTYQARIEKLESMVERLEEKNMVLKELKSVHSIINFDEPVMKKEKSSKQEKKIAHIDADVEINLEKTQAKAYNLDLDHQEKVLSILDATEEEPVDVEEVLEVVKAAKLITKVVTTAGATKVVILRKIRCVIIQDPKETKTTVTMQPTLDEEVARQLEAELNADINWNAVIGQIKRSERLTDAVMKYQDQKKKPFTEAQSRRNMIVYLKNMVHKGVKFLEKEVRQEKEVKVESSKREGRSLEQEIVKKQKIEQETEELKKHLQIVLDDGDDDDVYTDAIPLASKIPIVDYKIHAERNRPYFKIIIADENHMLFISFSTMTKNFDREDLESLWKIIRERFGKT